MSDRKDRHSGVTTQVKKGGAGGKGTWGTPGSEVVIPSADSHDPNYDSEEEAYTKPVIPSSIVSFKDSVKDLLREYYESGDLDEAIRSLNELDMPHFHHEFIKLAVSLSLDKSNRERELTSVLLSCVYSDVIDADKIIQGFDSLLDRIEDLSLDIPNITDLLSCFIARAIIDDILAPAYVWADWPNRPLVTETLSKTAGLIHGKHAAQRLAHVWGPGDGKSVKRLKERVILFLEEYMTNRDFLEADRCVRELNAPSFHFQIVKRALILAMEKALETQSRSIAVMTELISQFYKEQLFSQTHIVQGHKFCIDSLPDLMLDIPNASSCLKELIDIGIAKTYLPVDFPKTHSINVEQQK